MTSVDAPTLNSPCSDNESSLDDFSSDDEIKTNNSTELDKTKPNSQSIWFRARKRLVGHVVNRQSIKSVAGINTYNLLIDVRNLMKLHMTSKEQVRKIYQALLKTIGKLAVVAQERKLTSEDYNYGREVKKQCRVIVLTCDSYANTDYTYDRAHLTNLIRQCENTLIPAARPYLSQRSLDRIAFLVNSIVAPEFLDSVFSPHASREQKKTLNQLIKNFHLVLAENSA